MFDHPNFNKYDIDNIPLNEDLYLRDEKDIFEYEKAALEWVSGLAKEWRQVGYVVFVAARRVTDSFVELTWIADLSSRYHSLAVTLPRNQIVCCVGAWQWDEKPSIFIKSAWIDELYRRINGAFGFIDAIGVRDALANGLILKERLPALRASLDEIAARFPSTSFVSFADSIILKSHWTGDAFGREPKFAYDPETMLRIFCEVREAYRITIGLAVYGVFTQGANEYVEDSALHVSPSGNHVCLNCLGAPFADLQSIESAARQHIKGGDHAPHELYLDEEFYRSLKLKFDFKEQNRGPVYIYQKALVKDSGEYRCASCDDLVANFDLARWST